MRGMCPSGELSSDESSREDSGRAGGDVRPQFTEETSSVAGVRVSPVVGTRVTAPAMHVTAETLRPEVLPKNRALGREGGSV